MTDVAQLVIRTSEPRYLLARRSSDGYWEWIGGKVEEDESVEEAAIREMKEELRIDWEETDYEIVGRGEPYLSEKDSEFRLCPVMIELGNGDASSQDLSEEHTELEWIELEDFYRYDTLGQYSALESLDLVEGDVALAVVRNGEEFLAVKRSGENSSPGLWGFVSGKIEPEETSQEAAVRELKEETGLEADSVRVGEPYIGRGELGLWRLFPVLMETNDRDVDLSWELSDHRWIKLEDFDDLEKMGRMKSLERLGLEQ